MYTVVFSKRAEKDKALLKAASLEDNAKQILNLLVVNPFLNPPPYEKLVGNLQGLYSRRINIQHRIVYSVDREAQVVHVLRMWTHYE